MPEFTPITENFGVKAGTTSKTTSPGCAGRAMTSCMASGRYGDILPRMNFWKRLRCSHRWMQIEAFEWGPWENEHDWSEGALARCVLCGYEGFVHPDGHQHASVVAKDAWA